MNIRRLTHLLVIFIAQACLFSCQNNNTSKLGKEMNSISIPELDSMEVPGADTRLSSQVEILIPTQYRKESMGYPKNIEGKAWYEIYKDTKTGDWELAKTNMQITYGRDECVGEDVMIIESLHSSAVLFFTFFPGLVAKPVTILEDQLLFPEHPVVFEFQGKEYRLSPMGTGLDESGQLMSSEELRAKTIEELDNNTRITGYRLAFGDAAGMTEIAVIENIEYATPRLIWAGDLNDDGLPDLILDLPDFYESRHVFFILSDKNDAEKPFKSVADLYVVNDC